MSVKPKRHIAKAITWRIIASLTTFIIGWLVTGDMEFGMTIGAFDVIIKIFIYYFHERAWYHSTFGIVHTNEKYVDQTIPDNQVYPTSNKKPSTRNQKPSTRVKNVPSSLFTG
jgi:uncharacterized membrane protein